MTDQANASSRLLSEIGKLKGPAPVHLWNPPYCGEIDIRIARDGSWFHEGSKISRLPLIKLFSSVLRREGDGQYCLVTPVERVGIQVEDCPFVATLLDEEQNEKGETCLFFTLNTGERVLADAEHAIVVEGAETSEPHPIVHVRGGLNALISRNVFYQLVSVAQTRKCSGGTELSVLSAGVHFSLGVA